MPSHRISFADDIRTGAAESADRTIRGVPLQNFVLQDLGTPAAAAANNIRTSAALTAATGQAPATGALAVGGVAILDVPRNVVAAWTNTAVLTVFGFDAYGNPMRESSASGTSFAGLKAFKRVTFVSVSADVTGLTVGTGAVLGLPYMPVIGGFLGGILNENTADAGTYVAPVRVAQTITNGDPRGTYAPAGTLNGTNRFLVRTLVANGPESVNAFGRAPFNG